MLDLIDRTEFCRLLEELIDFCSKDEELEVECDTYENCLWELKAQTPVDAVEVVRCKDCIHVRPTLDGRWICGATLNPNWVSEEHFCSYGERRGSNE